MLVQATVSSISLPLPPSVTDNSKKPHTDTERGVVSSESPVFHGSPISTELVGGLGNCARYADVTETGGWWARNRGWLTRATAVDCRNQHVT
ncbi:hypothetical protein B296_00058870 [Ensete ventricosum]|uniref:Uncharacterized protein n=1 Tax=Ensete ventricosum TaxID=4639 RepID=A0A426X410_ENSVE|nr:hypothetical protein B296_00058870 [Ensete ventricosum]